MSSMCAAVCRRTPSCGRTSTRGVGRAASTSPSSNKLNCTVLAALGRRSHLPVALCISLSSPLALAIVGLLGAEWWVISARAIATVIRSCRNMERSRRSLLRLAAEVPASRATKAIATRLGSAHKSSHEKKASCLVETPVVFVGGFFVLKEQLLLGKLTLAMFFVDFRT